MELLKIDCLGKELRLEGSIGGVGSNFFRGGDLVSTKQATADNQGRRNHHFELTSQPTQVEEMQVLTSDASPEPTKEKATTKTINVNLDIDLIWQPFQVRLSSYYR